MRGLRDSDGESDDGAEEAKTVLTYVDGMGLAPESLLTKGNFSRLRSCDSKPDIDRVGRLEQRVSKLESLLQIMSEHDPITVTQESGEWFAHDAETGVSGNGETRAQAIAQVAEAIAYESGEISFSEGFAADVEDGRRQIAAGNTSSSDDVRDRLGIDD